MNAFVEAISQQVSDVTDLSPGNVADLLETPPNPEMGDYAFPCFTLAKSLRKAPNAIAEELASQVTTGDHISQVKAAGPYLNFFVSQSNFVSDTLGAVLAEGVDYGQRDEGAGKTILIDFSHPNIARPFGIHHLRSTVLGNALRNIFRKLGYEVVGINHLGDWGSQFAKLIVAWNRWGEGELTEESVTVQSLLSLYVKIHEEIENDPTVEEEASEWFRRLEAGDDEAVRMWKVCCDVSWKEFSRVYDRLGIEFESIAGESFYQDKMQDTLNRLEKKKLVKRSQGATIVDLEEWDMPPLIALRSDDATLYATRDLAAAEYRYETYKFAQLLYVVDVAQSLHFKQLFKVLGLMGYDWSESCSHVVFGRLRFKGGSMSTRKGQIIFLEDVLDKAVDLTREIILEKNPDLPDKDQVAEAVGIGAVIFADMDSRRVRDVVFDWDEVLNFNGETGPYVQYTHARFCSVLRNYGQEVSADEVDFGLLSEPETLAVVKCLGKFPTQVEKAGEEYEPSYIASYLIDLCSTANRFYGAHKVVSDDPNLSESRVALVNAITHVLASGLALLGMKAPERM